MQADEFQEGLVEGARSPLESATYDQLFKASQLVLISLKTAHAEQAFNQFMNQLALTRFILNISEILVGFIVGYSSVRYGLGFITGVTLMWIIAGQALAQLGLTLLDVIVIIAPVAVGVMLRLYQEYKRFRSI